MQEHNGCNGGNKERTAIHIRFVMGENNVVFGLESIKRKLSDKRRGTNLNKFLSMKL